MDSLKEHVTHFAQDLNEAKHQERVSVAGVVTKIRHHQTKNGKAMAFATIEDIQGTIDLVIFPNTWSQYAEIVRFDEIIYVKGKADANGGDTKVLVDQISTSLTHVEPLTPAANTQPTFQEENKTSQTPTNPLPLQTEDEETQDFSGNDFPFPPEDPSLDPEQDVPSSEPIGEDLQSTPPADLQVESALQSDLSPGLAPAPEPAQSPDDAPQLEMVGAITLEEDSTYLITIILKNRGDTMRDKLRLRQVYGTLISYPGKDRFAFQISENDRSHLLEFPNATTRISKNLINQLREMLGRENVQVEKYLF